MKHLSELILTALLALGTLPGAHADTRQCNCACPCETSATSSTAAGVLAIPKPPPPVVVEVTNDDELDLRRLGTADATVEVTYPEIADGHTVGLRWTSPIQRYDAPVQHVSGGARKLTFRIPNATVVNDLGQSAVLTASVGVGNESLVISHPRTIKVIRSTPGGQFAPPTLPDFTDAVVDIGALTGDLKVRVADDSIGAGKIVKVLWRGVTSYDTPMRLPPDNTPLEFTIPHATVMASLGHPVTLSYEVTPDGQATQPSVPLELSVLLRTLKEVPTVTLAGGGTQVDLKDLRRKPLDITYTYTGITPGHTVGIRWVGSPVYDTPHPVIGATPRPLQFTIPYDTVFKEKGKTVFITASVGVGDGHLAISPPAQLRVIDSRPSGEQVANDLNLRYNDTRTSCTNDQPAYYCSGVTTRGTSDGDFYPWDPSQTQLRKGSISFSYLRKDAGITDLWANSGYALLSQDQAIAQNKQYDYLCSYPHDGWTDINRPSYGCGFVTRAGQRLAELLANNPELAKLVRHNDTLQEQLMKNADMGNLMNSNPQAAQLLKAYPTLGAMLRENDMEVDQQNSKKTTFADVSTCASVGVTTLATWNTYSKDMKTGIEQCSLSTENAVQFDMSLKAREYPLQIHSPWNEVLIRVWTAGIPAQLPIAAFYYENPTGLAEAKVYQQKYVTATNGLWLPIIKLDAAQLGANPFSYSAADQAVQP